jgi:hypothetical protein
MNSLSKMGRSGTMKPETTSPSESAFSDTTHLSQFTGGFIFDDDSSTTTSTSSSSRLPSIPRSIWKDEQGLGVAIGGASYLPRYLQMGNDDDDSFPTMVRFERAMNRRLSFLQHRVTIFLTHYYNLCVCQIALVIV